MEPSEGTMIETSRSEVISTKLARIATLSREKPQMVWTTLAHHIDVDWLREAFARTRKDGATGVDRQTAREYEEHLEDSLRALLERVHAGQYRARLLQLRRKIRQVLQGIRQAESRLSWFESCFLSR